MDTLFNHPWILFIAVTIVNGLLLKYNSKKHIAKNPSLKKGYENYFKGWIFYANIPWVIMAIGQLAGLVNNSFEFFQPSNLNPIVLIFYASIIGLWILSGWWIYFRKGAEFIEKHPGLFQMISFSGESNMTAKQVKIFYPLMIFGGIMGLIMIWGMGLSH